MALYSSDVAGAPCPVCDHWSSFRGASLCVGLSSSGEAGVHGGLTGQSPECVPSLWCVTTLMALCLTLCHPVPIEPESQPGARCLGWCGGCLLSARACDLAQTG